MTDLEFTKEDASEAFYNIGKLAGRLSNDEGKRLLMLIQIIASYTSQLAEENKRLRDGDNFDMDGRC
jgi:hypothetical protein